MFVFMFVSLSTQSSSAHVEETDQELLRAHSQTREHWGRECTFSYLGPVGFLKWSSKANRGGGGSSDENGRCVQAPGRLRDNGIFANHAKF